MTLRVVVVAEESAGIQLLRSLEDRPVEVVSVVTGSAQASRAATVGTVAQELGLPLAGADRVKSPRFASLLRDWRVDLLLNAHSLHILPEAVLTAPRLGCYNLHPGPLPEMAGLNVPSWAVFLRNSHHAVTVHRMDPGIDTGAVAFRQDFELGPTDTGLTTTVRCVRAGVPLMLRVVDHAMRGDAIPAHAQDLDRRVYYDRAVPGGGWIDWSWGVRRIEAFARACDYGPFTSPWGKPRVRVDQATAEVGRVEVLDGRSGVEPGTVESIGEDWIDVAARDGRVRLHRLRLSGDSDVRELSVSVGMRLGSLARTSPRPSTGPKGTRSA